MSVGSQGINDEIILPPRVLFGDGMQIQDNGNQRFWQSSSCSVRCTALKANPNLCWGVDSTSNFETRFDPLVAIFGQAEGGCWTGDADQRCGPRDADQTK